MLRRNIFLLMDRSSKFIFIGKIFFISFQINFIEEIFYLLQLRCNSSNVVLATIPLFDLKHPHNIDCLIDLIPCFDEKKTTDACHPAFLKAVVDNLFGTDHKLHKSL